MDEFNINLSGSNSVQKKKEKKEKEFEFNEEVSLFNNEETALNFDGIEITGADVKPPEPGKVFEFPVKGKESEFVSSLNKEDKELFIRAMDFVLKSAEKELKNSKKEGGIVSDSWDMFKNLTGMQFGSDNIQDRINKLKIQVEDVKKGKLSLTSLYKEVTGNELTEQEIENILNNPAFSKAKALKDVQGFKEGQKQFTETVSSIASAGAAMGVNAFTGGTAGLIQLFSAAFLGYIAPSSIEHASDNDGYTKEEIKQDLAKGTASGIVNASGIKAFNAAKPILGAEIMGTGNAVSNQAIDQYLKDGKLDTAALTETAAVTGIAALAAMYTASNVSNVIRPLLIQGNEMLPNILGRLVSSAASGAAAGSAAASSAGSSKYIIDKLKNGEEIKLDELINAASSNIPNGAIMGAGLGAAFETIQIAGGLKAPKGAVRYEDVKTKDGIKARNYLDKEGNILASDMKAKDILKFMQEKAGIKPKVFKTSNETALTEYNDVQKFDARTLRMTYSRSTKGLELYSWSDKGFRFETANLEPAPEIGAGKNTAIVKAENTSGKNPFNSNNSSNNGTKSLPQGTLALPEGNPSARTMQAKYGGDIVTNDGVISNNGGTPSPSLPGGEGGLPAPNPFENASPVEPPINTNGSEITAGAAANTANGINTPKAGLNAEQPQSPHRTVKTEEAPEIEIKTAPENTKPAPVKPENNQNTGNAGSGTNAAGVNEPSAHNPSGVYRNESAASEIQTDAFVQAQGDAAGITAQVQAEQKTQELTDEEFEALKQKFYEQTDSLPENIQKYAVYWGLNKFNINTAMKIISAEKLYRNSLTAGSVLSKINNEAEAIIAERILSGSLPDKLDAADTILKLRRFADMEKISEFKNLNILLECAEMPYCDEHVSKIINLSPEEIEKYQIFLKAGYNMCVKPDEIVSYIKNNEDMQKIDSVMQKYGSDITFYNIEQVLGFSQLNKEELARLNEISPVMQGKTEAGITLDIIKSGTEKYKKIVSLMQEGIYSFNALRAADFTEQQTSAFKSFIKAGIKDFYACDLTEEIGNDEQMLKTAMERLKTIDIKNALGSELKSMLTASDAEFKRSGEIEELGISIWDKDKIYTLTDEQYETLKDLIKNQNINSECAIAFVQMPSERLPKMLEIYKKDTLGKYSIPDAAALNDEQYEKFISLYERISDIDLSVKYSEDNEQSAKFIKLLDKGAQCYHADNMLKQNSEVQLSRYEKLLDEGKAEYEAFMIASLNDEEYKKYEYAVSAGEDINIAYYAVAKFNDKQFERYLELKKDNVSSYSTSYSIKSIVELEDNQYSKFKALIKDGIKADAACIIAELDEKEYKECMNLINNKGVKPETAAKLAPLRLWICYDKLVLLAQKNFINEGWSVYGIESFFKSYGIDDDFSKKLDVFLKQPYLDDLVKGRDLLFREDFEALLDLNLKYNKLILNKEMLPSQLLSMLDSDVKYSNLVKLNKTIGLDNAAKLSAEDTKTAAKFISICKKQSINEIPLYEKRDFLRALVSSNADLFSMSDTMKEMFPLLPKNQEEYCALLPSIVRSLGIETNTLSDKEISAFNQNTQKLAQTLSSISDEQFKSLEINQEYSKNDFIKDVLEKVKELPSAERQKVFDYFGFELHQNKKASSETGYSITGYPVNLNNGKKLAEITNPETKAVVERLRADVIRFSENNPVICKNKELAAELNDILEALPELRASIGNKQHKTHDYDVFKHSLKVLKGIVQTPEYQALNESDKKIMRLASLLHDITKKEGYSDKTHADYSSFDASFIAEKFKLTQEEQIKLYTLIKNHEWLEYVNTSSSQEQLDKRLQSIAYNLRHDNLFGLALMFTHADLKAVNDVFHDVTLDETGAPLKTRTDFNGSVRSFGDAADLHAGKIRGYIEELKKSQPLLPVTPVPKADTILKAVTKVNADGSTNIKGIYIDKDGLVVIKFNELQNEDLEKIGFPNGSTVSGIETITEKGAQVNTGNVKFFAHGLDFPNQLIKFDAFSLADSDALLSVSYAERPESKYRFFRPQGIILDCSTKYVHGGGDTDAGSGCGKNINEFKENYIFGGYRESDRTYISDLIKKTLNLNDEEYIKFVKENENKPLSEITPLDAREKLIKAFAGINSNVRNGDREYNEMYISNPKPPMAVFAYSTDSNSEESIFNPIQFLNRTEIGENDNYDISVKARTDFLRAYALEHNLPFIVFGD